MSEKAALMAPTASSSSAEAASAPGDGDGKAQARPTPTPAVAEDAASAVRQVEVAKLRRFLSTLVQFGLDIGPDAGDRVRDLVLRLLDSTVSIEEFHAELQGATNYPLRPFVIPFLRASLPLMQCELLHRARLAGRLPAQFLADSGLAAFLQQQQQQEEEEETAAANGGSRKRQAESESIDEPRDLAGKRAMVANGNASLPLMPSPSFNWPTASRQLESAPEAQRQARSQPHLKLHHQHHNQQQQHQQHRHPEQPRRRRRSKHRQLTRAPRRLRRAGQLEATEEATDDEEEAAAGAGVQPGDADSNDEADDGAGNVEDAAAVREEAVAEDDKRNGEAATVAAAAAASSVGGVSSEWSRLEAMLASLADLVGRARKSLTSLLVQQSALPPPLPPLHESNRRRRRDDDGRKAREQQLQQHQHQQQHLGELVSAIRRQAQQEVQLAVAAAEEKSARLVSAEKLRMERLLAQAREEALAAVRVQSGSAESCWNCGRIASETCSGCSIARYCGSFCQHKDWEKHQRACAVTLERADN